MRKLALKRLTASDLTLFRWHFRNRPAGNQKAINLNAEIFISELYPALPELAHEFGGRLPLDLSIFGPGFSGLDNRQRKIMKHGSYKNWRLDGEFIDNLPDEPERYNALAPGDFAIFEFFGAPIPTAAKMVLLSRAIDADARLIQFLDSFLGSGSMVKLSVGGLEACLRVVSPAAEHPIWELEIEAAIEDAALGGLRGIARLNRQPGERRISYDELLRARRNMEQVGRLGEELLDRYFERMKNSGQIEDYRWVSDANAVSPYDFEVFESRGELIYVDVKATAGDFERPLHISISELRKIADAAERYDIYRIYGASSEGASLRIVKNLRDFAQEVLKILATLPNGVLADGISVLPSSLPFEEEMLMSMEMESLSSLPGDREG